MIEVALCGFEAPRYLFFSSNVPTLLYFSHFPALIFSLACGFYVLARSRGRLSAQILFWSLIPFALWVFFDLILWASNRSDVVLYFWSLLVLIEPMTHAGMWYLFRVVASGDQDVSFSLKTFSLALFLPLFFIVPTSLGLPGFDVTFCIAVESFYLHYAYVLEIFFILFIFIDAVRFSLKAHDGETRRKILYLAGGILLFLFAFSSGNVIGSLTNDWNLAQVGLFGSPVFIGILVFLLVRFRLFNIQVLAAQMLVIVLGASVFTLLFLRTVAAVRIVTGLALVLIIILGYALIRNVRREVEARKEIERLVENLKIANERLKELDRLKNQFLSIATHDLRAPLTAIRNFMSLLIDGTYGKLPSAAEEGAHQVFDRATEMAKSVDNYLNISRIEQGRMNYDFAPADLNKIVADTADLFTPIAEKKGLQLAFKPEAGSYNLKADTGKLHEVFNNLLDNSIKYTPTGSVTVALEKRGSMARITIKDTGIGMTQDTMGKLFKLFSTGDDARKVNVSSTGVGLFIVKAIIEAHHGKVWAESEGEGKGSRFIVELPIQ